MFYKKIFLFFLLFPLFFLEIHFSFQEIGGTASFISIKQAAGDLEKDTDQEIYPGLSPEVPSPNQKEITARAKPSNTTDTATPTSLLPPIEQHVDDLEDTKNSNEKCSGFTYDSGKSPTEMENKINQIQTKISPLETEISGLTNAINNPHSVATASLRPQNKQKKTTKEGILNQCNNIKQQYETALSKGKTCEEDFEAAEKTKTEFSKDCAQFSGGTFLCSSAIKACANCPDKADSGGYDCVKIQNKAKCPALSGQELKAAKEKRDKANEEIEKFQEKIKDLEKDIISKENVLNEALSKLDEEFTEANRKMERQVEELKADLEHQLKKNKILITKVVSESIAKVQAEIDNFLKVAHTFENALTKANMEYRKERRQIISECEVQAQGRLSQFRKKRKARILSGSLKLSLSSLLTKGRTTFGQKDASLIKKYYSQCLSKRKPDFKEIYNKHQQKLRVIDQQKAEYQHQLNKAKQKISDLNNQAAQGQNKQLKEYMASMDKILASQQKETYALNLKHFNSKQALLKKTRDIAILKEHRTEHSLMLQEKQMELVHEQGLISYLKQMGVEEEDQKSEFTQAAGSYSEYEGAVRTAYSSCSCARAEEKGKKDFLLKKCSIADKNFKHILEDLDLEKEDSDEEDTTPKKDKASFKPQNRHNKNLGSGSR